MTIQQRTVFWVALVAGAGTLLWLLSPILLPFVLGIAFAYFVDPLVAWLERRGMSRATASAGIVFGGSSVAVLAFLLIVPVLIEQITSLATHLPDLVAWVHRGIVPVIERVAEKIGAPLDMLPSAPTAEMLQRVAGMGSDVLGSLVSRGLAIVSLLSLVTLTPIVSFYLLRDWPRVVAEIDGWLPRTHAPVIREQIVKIDAAVILRGSSIMWVRNSRNNALYN